MADRNALTLMGLLLGAATMFVVSVGTVLVASHGTAPLQLASNAPAVTSPAKLQ
ncbi:MAG TPA: hypothetical protein VE224_14150 [Pseudolabrys sp.]|jgi:hypothetical protein|nr:hypothetical protein [Pseudolabrys sp.]